MKNGRSREIDPDLVSGEGEPHEMLGRKERRQPELFVAGALRDVLPDDHVLVRVDRVLDLSWLRGEAKTWHGLARAVRRGLQNMRIQAFLTAAAVNLKRLAAALLAFLLALWSRITNSGSPRLRPAA